MTPPESLTKEGEPLRERITSRSIERMDYGEMWVKQGVRAVLRGGALLEFERMSIFATSNEQEKKDIC